MPKDIYLNAVLPMSQFKFEMGVLKAIERKWWGARVNDSGDQSHCEKQ
jgi:hypothetical protein